MLYDTFTFHLLNGDLHRCSACYRIPLIIIVLHYRVSFRCFLSFYGFTYGVPGRPTDWQVQPSHVQVNNKLISRWLREIIRKSSSRDSGGWHLYTFLSKTQCFMWQHNFWHLWLIVSSSRIKYVVVFHRRSVCQKGSFLAYRCSL
jgi:hypothetical protein